MLSLKVCNMRIAENKIYTTHRTVASLAGDTRLNLQNTALILRCCELEK